MINFELQKKIIDCTATEKELLSFFPQDKQEYDLDNSFDKYFSLEKIKNALTLYFYEEISVKYLAYWATAYDWILLATHWHGETSSKGMQNLKDNLVESIGDWLDGLSFLDSVDGDNWYYLQDFYQNVSMYYQIYKTLPQWEVFYCEDWDYDGKDWINVNLLCVNQSHKVFLTLDGALESENELVSHKLTPKQFAAKTQQLKQADYWEDSLSQQNSFIPN